MGHGRLALDTQTTAEVYIPYEFRPTVLPGCGYRIVPSSTEETKR